MPIFLKGPCLVRTYASVLCPGCLRGMVGRLGTQTQGRDLRKEYGARFFSSLRSTLLMPLTQSDVHSNSPLSSSFPHSRTQQAKTLVLDVEQKMLIANFRWLVQDKAPRVVRDLPQKAAADV